MTPTWQTAWVTGASSGIGRAIALELTSAGSRVAVSARRREELERLAAQSGGKAHPVPLDVTEAEEVARVVDTVERELGEIELAVLCAGVWTPFSIDKFEVDEFAKAVEVNFMGVVHALAALLPRMRARGRGHIAIVASVAGYVGFPRAETYAPTKAALINLAEGLAVELRGSGVTISVVNPGFVETPMTQKNDFPMPFIIPAEDAARRAVAGLRTGRFEVIFPRRMALVMKVLRMLPYPIFFPLMSRTLARR